MATQVESSLVASGNTYNPSLIVLRQKGYDIWLEKGDAGSLWCAKKGDQRFMGYSGPELLGLVALWEHLGEGWNQQAPDIYGELLDKMEDEARRRAMELVWEEDSNDRSNSRILTRSV